MAPTDTWAHRRRTRRLVATAMVAIVVAAVVLAGRALADTGSGGSSFRTAVVKRAAVTQTLQRSGTIEPIAQATVAFPIAGTVASVGVQPGQTVTTGQTLATLDTTSLAATLASRQATLAATQLTLSNALNGISSESSAAGGNGQSTTRTTSSQKPSTSSSASSASATTDNTTLQAARQGVASGQQRVDGTLGAAKAALQAATAACTAAPQKASTSTSSSTPTSSSTSTSTTTSTTAPTTQTGTSGTSDCVTALQNSLAAQQDVAAAQSALAQAESKLDALLSTGSSKTSNTAAAGTTSAPTSTSVGPTSAELVADQAAVDAAQADVNAAEQNVAQGAIVSPIDGTVAAVNLRPGDQVTAASSTANIIVVGPGGYEVTTTALVTDIGKVKLGDSATVLPDGSSTPLDGKVVSIGVVPSTSGTSTTYPVVVGLSGSPSGLRAGAAASVTITLNQAADALAVPTSAVRAVGGGAVHVATVLTGAKTSAVPVQVGAVGADLTEIRSGLQEGQTVVIADLEQALPSSNTTTGRTGFGGGGLGGGGGFGGGGFGGGRGGGG